MLRQLKSRTTRCQRRLFYIFVLTFAIFYYIKHKHVVHETIHDLNNSQILAEIYPDRRPKSRNFRRNRFVVDEEDHHLEQVEIDRESRAKIEAIESNDSDNNNNSDENNSEENYGDFGVDASKIEVEFEKEEEKEREPENNNNNIHHNDLFPKPVLGISGSWHDVTKKQTPEQKIIVQEFLYAWNAYKKSAWGKDTLRPLSNSYETWFNMGLTILDSLDNLIIFGLKDEFEEAKNWVANDLSFDQNIDYVNLFECTIRVLGGLLSAHTLSAEPVFLDKAKDIGGRLLNAWSQSKSKVPLSDINPYTQRSRPPKWSSDSSTSEVTTVQLEFRELAMLAKDPKFTIPARQTSRHVHELVNQQSENHFVQMMINPHSGKMGSRGTITFGARTDSYYEYLLKQWIQGNGDERDDWLLEDYLQAMEDLKKHLIKTTNGKEKLTFVAELAGGSRVHPKMDHLVCFLPGTLALGHYFVQQNSMSTRHVIPDWHLELAEELARTCFYFYKSFQTGLPPEIVYFDLENNSKKEIYVKPLDAFSILRPESVESWFYLYRITKNPIYRTYGQHYLTGLQNYAKVDNNKGYASIDNVDSVSTRKRDKMESFFMAETLKYLYLLFSDDEQLLPIDKFVFNTEAHPLLIRTNNNDIMFEE